MESNPRAQGQKSLGSILSADGRSLRSDSFSLALGPAQSRPAPLTSPVRSSPVRPLPPIQAAHLAPLLLQRHTLHDGSMFSLTRDATAVLPPATTTTLSLGAGDWPGGVALGTAAIPEPQDAGSGQGPDAQAGTGHPTRKRLRRVSPEVTRIGPLRWLRCQAPTSLGSSSLAQKAPLAPRQTGASMAPEASHPSGV